MNIILQTPEFLQMKDADAINRLGPHLIIGIAIPNGFVFGKMFNERAHEPQRWIWFINAAIAVAGIGDFGDFRDSRAWLEKIHETIDRLVGGHYTTIAGLTKSIRTFLVESESRRKGIAVELVFADVGEKRFWLVDVDGHVKNFSDFVIAGCRYKFKTILYDQLTEEERAHLEKTKGVTGPIEDPFIKPIAVRDAAVEFLEEEYKKHGLSSFKSGRKIKESLKAAESLIIETLSRFDTESPTGVFELISYRQGSRKSIEGILQRSIVNQLHIP